MTKKSILGYDEMYNGDTFYHPLNETLWLMCCDCGKVEKIKFELHNFGLIIAMIKIYNRTEEARKIEELSLQPDSINNEDTSWVMIKRSEYKKLLKGGD